MRILIADASKAGLVMTSELFKDHFPGVQVSIARTSQEVLEAVESATETFDLIVVDYDLPDVDGIATASALKAKMRLPVVITAVDRDGLGDAIEQQLAPFQDCCHWLKKPLRAETTVGFVKDLLSGAINCERRLPCGALTWATVSPPKKSRLKGACLPMVIEDVSYQGFNLRLATDPLGKLTAAHKKSLHTLAQTLCVEGHQLEIHLPELGQKEAQEKLLRLMWRQGALGPLDKEAPSPAKKTTLSGLGKSGSKKKTAAQGDIDAGPLVKGHVVAVHQGGDEEGLCLGVQFQEPSLAHVEQFFKALLSQTSPSEDTLVVTPPPRGAGRGSRGRLKAVP